MSETVRQEDYTGERVLDTLELENRVVGCTKEDRVGIVQAELTRACAIIEAVLVSRVCLICRRA